MLEPIAVELLLREVIFYSFLTSRFYYALEKMGSETWNPGVHTQRVTILLADTTQGEAAALYAQLITLHDYCPNARAITTFTPFHGIMGPTKLDVGWTHHATQAIFQLPFLSTDCLVTLTDRNPELETLALIAERPEKAEATLQASVAFPQLKQFFISHDGDGVFAHLSAPNLEWLGFDLYNPSNEGLTGFLKRNCTVLTYLHLKITYHGDEGLPSILYLLYLCPRLQTLSLGGQCPYNYDVDPHEPHPSLQHLILRCGAPYDIIDWLEMFGLADGGRPLLSFATITIRLFRRYSQRTTTFETDKKRTLEGIDEYCGKLNSALIFEELL